MKRDYWHTFIDGGIYHIYNRNNNNEIIFRESQNFKYFLKKLKKYIGPYFYIYGYCILPDHFHLMVRVKKEYEISISTLECEHTTKSRNLILNEKNKPEFLIDQFKRLFSSYALAFNKRYNRHGSVFQKRFKRIIQNEDIHIVFKLLYIHHNPIHHNYVTDYHLWPFSSYNAYFTDGMTNICKHEILNIINSDNHDIALQELKSLHVEAKMNPKFDAFFRV